VKTKGENLKDTVERKRYANAVPITNAGKMKKTVFPGGGIISKPRLMINKSIY
jgi:hypothetical protein